MRLKGQATIELTNVETGEKRVVKDNNMVTNALNEILKPLPFESSNPLYKLFYPYPGTTDNFDDVTSRFSRKRSIEMLTGGLILFDGQIDEDPDNYFPPAGIETVGCGVPKAYSGLNVMAGSYNLAESGSIENGYKHVWDFSTSQGNGHIACACLTTREGGFPACGTFPYDSNYRLSSASSPSSLISTNDQLSRKSAEFNTSDVNKRGSMNDVLYIDANKNQIICLHDIREMRLRCLGSSDFTSTSSSYMPMFFHSTKMKLTLDIKRIPLTSFGIFDRLHAPSIPDSVTSPETDFDDVVKTVELEIPQEIQDWLGQTFGSGSNYVFYNTSEDEGHIYISFCKRTSNYLAVNDKIYVWKINTDTFESDCFTITNTTGKEVIIQSSTARDGDYLSRNGFHVSNEHAFFITIDGNMYKVLLSDNTNVQQIVWPDGTPYVYEKMESSAYVTYMKRAHVIHGKFYIGNNVVDLTSNVIKYRNISENQILGEHIYGQSSGNTQYNASQQMLVVRGSKQGLIASKVMVPSSINSSKYYCSALRFGALPELLVTINNLSKPVTKSSAETMKITYTLTWDLEGGDSQ